MKPTDKQISDLLDTFGRKWDETPKNPPSSTGVSSQAHPPAPPDTNPFVDVPQLPMQAQGRERLPRVKDLDKEELIALIDAILTFDPVVIQDSDTGASNLKNLSLEQRMAIRSVEIREEKEKGVKVGQVVKITFWSKETALELAMKYKKMLQAEDNTTNNFLIITDRLTRGRDRLKQVKPKLLQNLSEPETDTHYKVNEIIQDAIDGEDA